jgi:hypothetical protein
MEVRLAGLRSVIGALFISILHLAWGLSVTLFSFVLLTSTLMKFPCKTQKPGLCLRYGLGVIWMHSFNGKQANGKLPRETLRKKVRRGAAKKVRAKLALQTAKTYKIWPDEVSLKGKSSPLYFKSRNFSQISIRDNLHLQLQ